MNDEAFAAALQVMDALQELDIPCFIGGSLASAVFGIPRSTIDADLVARMDEPRVQPLVQLLGGEFYSDTSAILEAVHQRSCFNLIHLPTMMKVDVFVPKDRAFDQEQLRRTILKRVAPGSERRVRFCSPEDTVLAKLEWYRLGGQVSDRQWNDILGVLKVQGGDLDKEYLRKWATALGVVDLLDKALSDALE